MPKKTKKQKHATKRKEVRKRQRAKHHAQPKLLRKDPVLNAALNWRHPLWGCLINEDWGKYKLASVYVIREAPSGFVLSNFLVDIAGLGLKDVWGDYGLDAADIEEIKMKSADNGAPLISCDLALVNDLVYGGVSWAKQWKFKLPKGYSVWLRLLEPVEKSDVEMGIFGENGKPLLILDEDDLDRIAEREFDPQIVRKIAKKPANGPRAI